MSAEDLGPAQADRFRRKAEELLRRAADTPLMERGRLIDEALHWHNLALDAVRHGDGRTNDNRDAHRDAEPVRWDEHRSGG